MPLVLQEGGRRESGTPGTSSWTEERYGGREWGQKHQLRTRWFDTSFFLDQVKDGEKKAKSEFSSDKNFFQEQQNKQNVRPELHVVTERVVCMYVSLLQKGDSRF